MITVSNYKILKALPSMPQIGDSAYCTDEEQFYEFDGTEWQKTPVPAKEISTGMTLYDMNKQILQQLPNLTEDKIQKGIELIDNLVKEIGSDYYMLLSNEMKYYTVFVRSEKHKETCGYEVIDCLRQFNIKSIERVEEDPVIEIWVEQDEKMYVMYFFDYRGGVIECLM